MINDDKGQTVLEYVLVITLVSLVILLAFNTDMRDAISGAAEYIGEKVGAVSNP